MPKLLTLLLLLLLSLTHAQDSSYSTSDILKFIDRPTTLPDVRVAARGRGGYGTSELQFEEPSTDLYAGVLLEVDILSSADIRKRREAVNQQRSEILALLSQLKEHLNLSWQYITQRNAYKDRLDVLKGRIEQGLENNDVVYPVEQKVIELNTSIYKEQAEITRAQLAIAAYAGDKWEELYSVVKAWDKVL
jgi:hypothetical protein